MGKNNQGFTLIEVMITLGLLSVVALAMSSMMMQQSREQKSAQVKATYASLVLSVQSAAASPKMLLDSSTSKAPANIVSVVNQMETTIPQQAN